MRRRPLGCIADEGRAGPGCADRTQTAAVPARRLFSKRPPLTVTLALPNAPPPLAAVLLRTWTSLSASAWTA